MATHFRATVFAGGSLAASGSNGHQSAGLLIFSASNSSGGLLEASRLADVGSDVFTFVSGSIGSRGVASAGAVLFGGDTVHSGSATALLGLSGSLTRLADGRSYLVGGPNVTVSSSSNGQVTLEASRTPQYWFESGVGNIYTTGTAAVNQAAPATASGVDQVFYVKGTVGGKSPYTNQGVSTIDGDFVVSGTIWANDFYGLNSNSVTVAGGLYTRAGNFKTQGNVSTVQILAEYETSEFTVYSDDGFGPYNHVRVFDMDGMGATRVDIGNSFSSLGRLNITGSAAITRDFTANLGLSGSLTRLHSGLSYMVSGQNIEIVSQSNGQVGVRTSNDIDVQGSFQVKGLTSLSGSVVLGDNPADGISFTGRANTSILPIADSTYDLGSAALRWNNIYTGDLHLRNERGDWTIVEEEDFLTITNNRSGKRYKFVLEEI